MKIYVVELYEIANMCNEVLAEYDLYINREDALADFPDVCLTDDDFLKTMNRNGAARLLV